MVVPTPRAGQVQYLARGNNLTFPGAPNPPDCPVAFPNPRLQRRAGAGYSLITGYELGVLKVLPMPAHLAFDAAKGAFMACSPWGSSASRRTAPATGCCAC